MQHNKTKIQLSKDELELVNNAQILLTKNRIINKVYELFGEVSEHYKNDSKDVLPTEVIAIGPKISRGENYEGLPYVMLDYPRKFGKEDTLAIRTFFWWGNFFSLTLQVSGCYKQLLQSNILEAANQNLLMDWHLAINENIWLHNFNADNYIPVTPNNLNTALENMNTIKLAKKIPLSEWDNVEYFLKSNFSFLLSVIKS